MSPLDFLLGAMSAAGIRIVESPLLEPKPKLKLSPGCPVSNEFRADMDAWLLERFGTEDPQIVTLPGGGLAVTPSVARALRRLP